MRSKNNFGIYPEPTDEHISLLRYSKSACGVDFLLNTAESVERRGWFDIYKNYKTDFFEFFFFRKANGYVIINGEKHNLTDDSLLRGHFINFEGHWGRSFEVIFSLL